MGAGRIGRGLFRTGLYLTLGILIGMAWSNREVRIKFGPDPAPRIDYVLLSESMTPYVPLWREETSRRYPNAVVVFVHGDDQNGEWVVVPDVIEPADGVLALMGFEHQVRPLDPRPVRQVINDVKARHPGRHVVLVTCNPGHYRLDDVEGVSYSLDNIWLMPDRYLHPRNQNDPDTDGSIFELIEN